MLLSRAAAATRSIPFTGEAIWITWVDGQSHVMTSRVRNDPAGELELRPQDGKVVRIGEDRGGLVDSGASWFLSLPTDDAEDPRESFAALEAKYEVLVGSPERIMDRPCARLEIRRREDGSLRERLWIDEGTGLLVRRETYDGGHEPARLAAYLSLDLGPADGAGQPARPTLTAARSPLRRQDASEIDATGLEALRGAGWVVPEELPGGYEATGVYAVTSDEAQPLQITYSDGLYTVSLFQQPGTLDWTSLRPGAEPLPDLGFQAYHWPGSVPAVYVWETAGHTYSIVGDAPSGDLHAIAHALPRPRPPSFGQRLGRGLGRLWSWVSPWS